MGTFMGHVFPGGALAGVALWWMVQILRRYYLSQQNGVRFKSTPTFKCGCLCGRAKQYEVEGLAKALLCAGGLIAEIITGFEGGEFVHYGNGQHSTMFIAFGISGILDVMRHHKLPVPEDACYAMVLLSLVIEGLLFNYHLHGRNEIDVLIHVLLVYTVFCNAIAVMAEMKFKNSLIAALSRAYFLFLQGIWFIAVAFILYNPFKKPDWNPKNHKHFMLATMLFTWHVIAAFIVILILNCIVSISFRKKDTLGQLPYHRMTHDFQESKGLLDKNSNSLDMDEMDDLELEPPLNGASIQIK